MAEDPVDPNWLQRTARREGYVVQEFERAYRLAHLLREIGQHPRLREQLALKGGTCINFFHDDLPRLSVDLDVNYIGSLDRDTMLAEREEVEADLKSLGEAHGYEWDPYVKSYAHRKLRLRYINVHGHPDSVRVDVNYLMRLPLYGTETHHLPDLFDLERARVPALSAEEVYGGKLKALAARGHPRDLFDAARLFDGAIDVDMNRVRAAFLFFSHMDEATLDLVRLERARALTEADMVEQLFTMLRTDERPTVDDLKGAVLPEVEGMLERTEDEIRYGTELEAGNHLPGLLFGKVDVADEIAEHPVALWRAKHPHGKRDGEEAGDE